jgi:CO dehydrogenase/acetyl-CoA synthase beta subunit
MREVWVETYDLYMQKLAGLVEEIRQQGVRVREFDHSGDPQTLIDELPLRVGPGAQEGIILRSDTYAELGKPSAGSSAFVMWTTDPSLVRDGRVTLVGPDIQEAGSTALPLGQVLIVGGRELGKEAQPVLEQKQYLSNLLEGYMVKSSPGRVWSRVSKGAAAKGLDFEMLGKALSAVYKLEVPKIESLEVLFVTSGKQEIKQLEAIAAQVRVLGKAFRRDALRAKGHELIDCTLGTDCASCEVKPDCDDIRDVVKIRKRRDRKEVVWAKRREEGSG